MAAPYVSGSTQRKNTDAALSADPATTQVYERTFRKRGVDSSAATKNYSGGELLLRAPAAVGLVDQPLVVEAARTLLGRHCKQIALKILTVISTHPARDSIAGWPHSPFSSPKGRCVSQCVCF